jgi:hypothetical protein
MTLSHLIAQSVDEAKDIPLFQSNEILNLRLSADFKSVFRNKDDSTYFPAKINFTDDSGISSSLDIRIRTRGKTRREKDVCTFTPLRLRFSKKGIDNTVFAKQKAIKLVTHCNNQNFCEQNTIIEYLIYRAFNILTDSSLKVRPAMINYVYTGRKKDSVQKFAFFLEHDRHLAQRLGGMEIEDERTHPNRFHAFHISLMDMFQYMIGNTDYSAYELHNIKLIRDETRRLPPIAIPYDFDWSGLVSAFYAVPNPSLNIEKVTDRVYRGFKKRPEIVYHSIKKFNDKKEEIYQLFNNFELLRKKERKQVIKYLDEFYWIINNKRMVQIEFVDKARIVHD